MKRLHATLILIFLAACVAVMMRRDEWMGFVSAET